MDALDRAVSAAALALPEGHIELLARALENLTGPSPSARAVFMAAATGAASRAHTEAISSAWEGHPDHPGSSLALALRCSVLAASSERASETLEIAWTGPATPAVPVRRTNTILLDLIAHSQRQLLVVSFAAYEVPEIIEALSAAISRGVEVLLLLESADESGGALRFDAREAFAALEGRARFYSWPEEQRRSTSGPHGTLHAKAVVADNERALVTSANLTGHALEVNMELGLLVEGGPIPQRLIAHFTELISRGVLREVN